MKRVLGFSLSTISCIVSFSLCLLAVIYHSLYEQNSYIRQIKINLESNQYDASIPILSNISKLPIIHLIPKLAGDSRYHTVGSKESETLYFLVITADQLQAKLFRECKQTISRLKSSEDQKLSDLLAQSALFEKCAKLNEDSAQLKNKKEENKKIAENLAGYESDYEIFIKDVAKALSVPDYTIGKLNESEYEFGLLAGMPKIATIEDAQNDLYRLMKSLYPDKDDSYLESQSGFLLQRIESLRDSYKKIKNSYLDLFEKDKKTMAEINNLEQELNVENKQMLDSLKAITKNYAETLNISLNNQKNVLNQYIGWLNFFLD